MNRRTLWLLPLALLMGAGAGWVDQHVAEVQVPAAILFAGALVLGWLQPAAAWLWVLLLGSSIGTAHFVAQLSGYRPPWEQQPNRPIDWLVPFVPRSEERRVGKECRSRW